MTMILTPIFEKKMSVNKLLEDQILGVILFFSLQNFKLQLSCHTNSEIRPLEKGR